MSELCLVTPEGPGLYAPTWIPAHAGCAGKGLSSDQDLCAVRWTPQDPTAGGLPLTTRSAGWRGRGRGESFPWGDLSSLCPSHVQSVYVRFLASTLLVVSSLTVCLPLGPELLSPGTVSAFARSQHRAHHGCAVKSYNQCLSSSSTSGMISISVVMTVV